MVVRRFFGEIILSSMKTRPKRLESFFVIDIFPVSNHAVVVRGKLVFSVGWDPLLSRSLVVVGRLKNSSLFPYRLFQVPVFVFFPGLSLVHVPSWHTVRLLHRRSVPNSSPVPPRLRGLGPFRSRLLLLLLESVYSVPVIVKMGTCLVVRVGTVVLAWADLEPRKDQRPLLCPSCLWLEASALLWADTLS